MTCDVKPDGPSVASEAGTVPSPSGGMLAAVGANETEAWAPTAPVAGAALLAALPLAERVLVLPCCEATKAWWKAKSVVYSQGRFLRYRWKYLPHVPHRVASPVGPLRRPTASAAGHPLQAQTETESAPNLNLKRH